MTLGPAVRYPAGPVTPHGAYHLLHDKIPWVALRSYDDSVVFNLMGGLAIPDRTIPERVELVDVRGWVPGWQTIDQKGATQDGTSFVDALYDPAEIELKVRAWGRDPAHCRTVVHDLMASIDPKKCAELSVFTHKYGRWWAPVRWFKTPDDALGDIFSYKQELSLRLRNDNAFWESYLDIDHFHYATDTLVEDFDFVTAPGDPITGWTLAYSGAGSGYLYTDGSEAVSSLVGGRTVVARNNSFLAGGDDFTVEVQLGTNQQWNWPANTYIDLWVRMNNTGTVGHDGLRWRIGRRSATLSCFVSGVETVLRTINGLIPYRPGERLRFITGVGGNMRKYRLKRNGVQILTYKEQGTTSLMDSDHRRAGFGEACLSGTVRPLAIREFKVTDTVTNSGFLTRVNAGDQPMWDRYTCIGPGTFYFGNGPDSSDMVAFGPLEPNQVMQVRTDPGKRGVVDLTSVPPTPQELNFWQLALRDLLTFISFGLVPADVINSILGIVPPQGNPYSLLDGRFSRPIPPRSPGNPLTPYSVKVSIANSTVDSQIIAAGTPRRRTPF